MNNILSKFNIEGQPLSCEIYGSGHINTTYLIITNSTHRYILQKINNTIFKDIPALMKNIKYVSNHLKNKGYDSQHALTIISTTDDNYFYFDGQSYWRVYDFIENSICLNQPESPIDFYQSAVAFGTFQNLLSDFEADKLSETIALFHNTPNRYKQLHEAMQNNANNRIEYCKAEIEFALAQEANASILVDMLKSGKLPLRVTHNDTKLNNVMLDMHTHEPLCVIDLDTVMPGIVANDFGDSIRFGASTGLEDEEDLSKVNLSLDLFDYYSRGFLKACGSNLTKTEIDTLPLGAKLMTLECGVRFLTDFLNGDVYFKVSKPMHNLLRARTQFKLVRDIEFNMHVLNSIINKYR